MDNINNYDNNIYLDDLLIRIIIMNIFVVYEDYKKCAKFLDNKRCIKQILESAQLLSNAIYLNKGINPYKPTHLKHPCTIWCSTDRLAYTWLLQYFKELCLEYTKRFNKIHKCSLLSTIFENNLSLIPIVYINNIKFVNCTGFKYINDVHLAYRYCLKLKWKLDKRTPKWR